MFHYRISFRRHLFHIPHLLGFLRSGRHASLFLDALHSTLLSLPLLLCIAATFLLTLVSLSSPIIDSVFFLGLSFDGRRFEFTERFGLFGYTTSKSIVAIGYRFPGAVVEGTWYDEMTKAFVLHPIAAVLAGLSVYHGASNSRSGAVLMTIFAAIASIITLAVWIIDMVVFTAVRDLYRFRNIAADYGNGLWLTLGAFFALLMSLCAGPGGLCNVSRYRRTMEMDRWQCRPSGEKEINVDAKPPTAD